MEEDELPAWLVRDETEVIIVFSLFGFLHSVSVELLTLIVGQQ